MTKKDLLHCFSMIPGWRTSRHLVIIESDDWGSIRMPSKSVYSELKKRGLEVDKCLFSKYDSLETSDDLECLFDVLQSVKDSKGNSAVITANSVVANPDFEKIQASGFNDYCYEVVTRTYSHQNGCSRSYALIKDGISSGIWKPQLHGREHLNVVRWMKSLQGGDEITRMCFSQGHFSLTKAASPQVKFRFMDAFANVGDISLQIESSVIKDAASIFEELYGYKSSSFIAPCYIWRPELESILKDAGVNYLQGLPLQQIPIDDNSLRFKSKVHFMGQKNKHDQYYLIRNVFYEPYKGGANEGIDDCLNRINIAFRFHKPAIISSHRINYIGSLDVHNRDRGLKGLRLLLETIVKQWPDVEFITSDSLGDIIKNES